nr:hypothetical protein [uncultured Rhodopila sp.]
MSVPQQTMSGKEEVKNIDLSALSQGMPGITSTHGQMLAEAAAVCLESQQHEPGVRFPKVGLMPEDMKVGWRPADDQQRRCYADMHEATEWGASAVAILMINEVTGKSVIERSKKGTGFDYWIGDNDLGALPFEGVARLEVSGILRGAKGQIEARVKQKKNQIEPTDHLAPGFVAIVEFGSPIACVEDK